MEDALEWKCGISGLPIQTSAPSPEPAHRGRAESYPEYAAKESHAWNDRTVAAASQTGLYPLPGKPVPSYAQTGDIPADKGQNALQAKTIRADAVSRPACAGGYESGTAEMPGKSGRTVISVSSFVGTISTWDQFGINFADWNRLMNLEEEPEGDEDCIDKIHEIEMKNVEFRYPQRSESAVKNINLRILTGEKIAIVGENGSGKTTLLYLLLGIYRPISGEASVNGKTMELNLDNYRKKTACLIQNFVHFQMTLRENLAPNDFSELSEDPLIDFANNFPDRLNTFLGALDSNGVELSGGQWKRIALYRTLHKKDVDLIVLDEPTANLDPKISENIINRLLKPNYNKTVIVITHDFELAKKFDRIIGMKEGKIICDSPPQAFAWELFEKHNSDKRSLPQIG